MTSTTESAAPPAPQPTVESSLRRRYLDLFFISFAILFTELGCIRFFGSSVIFLTFFTNIVLMACFLGMSVGLLASSRRRDLVRAVIPILLVSVVLAMLVLWGYERFSHVVVGIGSSASPQQVYFGTEQRVGDPSRFVVPIEVVAGVFFVLIALAFVGMGQVMGRTFAAIPNRVMAYTADVAGSLAGIAAFGLASYLQTTPLVWFVVSVAICLYFVRPFSRMQLMLGITLLLAVARYGYGIGLDTPIFWSPYYKITYYPWAWTIATNNMPHQAMVPIPQWGAGYMLPYRLIDDAAGRKPKNILIIGAGSGNDVAAALLSGAEHVDAVEIDPVINALGRKNHPNHPFADPRVTVHLDDGRSFLKKTDRRYDLVIYALVDSLVLHSGYSSLRLESFLFTEDSFRDVRRVLKPDGMFAMYNYYRQPWVVERLAGLARRTFEKEPVVIPLGNVTEGPGERSGNSFTFVLCDNTDGSTVQAVRRTLDAEAGGDSGAKWRSEGVHLLHADATQAGALLPSDNWPFLYLKERSIPAVNVRGAAIIAVLSAVLLMSFAPVRTIRLNGTMFFLGAGFMLLETKGVVHMALLFGSTWVVNSIVFAAILVMILLANLFVLRMRPRRLTLYYILLLVTLLAGALVPMSVFLSLPGTAKTIASCALVFAPVFFAGVIFATTFRDSAQPDVDFGSNVAGIILGGLSETLSLLVGFNYLLLIAAGFYVLAALVRRRPMPMPQAVAV